MTNLPSFNEFLNESVNNDKVYIQQNTLWVSYSPNSGRTTQIKGDPDKFRGFFSNETTDEHYDGIVDKLLDWAKKETPLVKKSTSSLYKIPAYWKYSDTNDLSVWNGDKKPDYFLWMLISTNAKYSIVNFFKTKQEAVAFI